MYAQNHSANPSRYTHSLKHGDWIMKRSLRNKWIAALRSGNYVQGMGQLCRAFDGNRWISFEEFIDLTHDNTTFRDGMLNTTVEELGIADHKFDNKNDSGKWNFNQIADYIEANVEVEEDEDVVVIVGCDRCGDDPCTCNKTERN